MSLFELDRVTKRHRDRGRTVLVLDDASLALDAGELAAVWGQRGSGKTSLLRLAAGIDAPDSGQVRFAGRDLARHGEEILGSEIAYCRIASHADSGREAIDDVVLGLLVSGLGASESRARAHAALVRVGAADLTTRRVSELDAAQRTRIAIAHGVALAPRLLLIDEPVAGVELNLRDDILLLLRSLANEGVAVLMTVGEATGLTGTDQSLTIGEGELHGSHKREPAPVSDLLARRRAAG